MSVSPFTPLFSDGMTTGLLTRETPNTPGDLEAPQDLENPRVLVPIVVKSPTYR